MSVSWVMTEVAADGPEEFIMSIDPHIFCWQGIATDVDQGKAFYHGVLEWKVSDDEGPPMFVAAGGPVAHLEPPQATPPAWCSYLSVEDLDATTALAAKQGSTVVVPPTDLPVGRFSMVTTPSGAVFGLYQAAEQDALAEPGPGSIHWVELHSTEIDKDIAWFESVFGFSTKVENMPAGPYHVLQAEGSPRGGLMAAQSGVSTFVAWVRVTELDATLARVKEHGGNAVTDIISNPTVGRMAIVSDPSGATFGLIQPA